MEKQAMKDNGNTATQERTGQHQPAHAERIRGGRTYVPSVDIIETPDEIKVLADVPGSSPENIDINFENGLLTIQARIEECQRPQNVRNLLREYGVGDFYRQFQIGEGIDASRIAAEVSQGVLTLHLPKSEEVKPKKIAVKAI
jgi:HSP20 family protein